jgi:hypothetical protein
VVVYHVDDFQYVGMTEAVEKEFMKEFQRHLPSKAGNECVEHLGVAVNQSDDCSTKFNQAFKILEYCEQFGVENETKKIRTMNFNGVISKAMDNADRYPKAIGCINYLVHNSRPDVMPVASLLASFTREPTEAHWKGVQDLLAYLKGTRERSITFGGSGGEALLKIDTYCDSSFNSPHENLTKKTQSRAGYLVFMNRCLIKWYSKLIRLTPQSTEEAEVIAANELLRYLKWLIGMLIELNIPFEKPNVYSDNQNAVDWMKTRAVTDRTKHFDVKLNMCRDMFENGDFGIEHVDGNENPADLMTKQLGWKKINQFCGMIGMMSGVGSG